MSSIAEITRELVKSKPFLEDALVRGIINYNSLAEELIPQIEQITGEKNVKLPTVAMALRRLGDQLQTQYVGQIEGKLKDFINSDMIIKYDLFEITVGLGRDGSIGSQLAELYNIVPINPNSFLSITQGTTETTIITQNRYKQEIMNLFRGQRLASTIDGLSALSIRIPENSSEVPGLFYYFTKALTMEGINIVELISTFSEMQFILSEDDVSKAAQVIRSLFKKLDIET